MTETLWLLKTAVGWVVGEEGVDPERIKFRDRGNGLELHADTPDGVAGPFPLKADAHSWARRERPGAELFELS